MNEIRDYKALEREYITGDMSLRGLCRKYGISAHSAVMVQARAGGWAEKRRTYRDRLSATYIETRADRESIRLSDVRDHAIDAIDETITRLRADLRATKQVRRPDGSISEEPTFRATPRDLAHVIDRLNPLFARPSTITAERSLTFNVAALPVEALTRIV